MIKLINFEKNNSDKKGVKHNLKNHIYFNIYTLINKTKSPQKLSKKITMQVISSIANVVPSHNFLAISTISFEQFSAF